MRMLVGIITLLFLCVPALAQEITLKRLGKVRVIDGDTIVVGTTRVRAVGYDTPEVHGRCVEEKAKAAQATARLRQLLGDPEKASLKWSKGFDKYGRRLARFYSNHKDVGPILISEGLAHPYDGGTKQPWCS